MIGHRFHSCSSFGKLGGGGAKVSCSVFWSLSGEAVKAPISRVWLSPAPAGRIASAAGFALQASLGERNGGLQACCGVRMNGGGDAAPADASDNKVVNVIIKGVVQGVYYRNWTVESAQQLGVNGWVRNLKNGSVEAVFSGKKTAVDALVEKCHLGPPAARVSAVEVVPVNLKEAVPQGFVRKPTVW